MLVATALLSVLAGPIEVPPVQRPTDAVAPGEPPPEPARLPPTPSLPPEAPQAEAGAGATPPPAGPEQAASSPGPPPDRAPAGETPFGAAPSPTTRSGAPATPLGSPAAAVGTWRRDYVEVAPPRFRGTGLIVGSGVGYAAAVVTQLIDATVYRNVGSGLLDRVFLLTGIALAPAGADARGRYDAYYDAAIGLPTRPTRPLIGAGLGLTLLGGLATVTSEVMWWQCAIGDEGPYHTGGTSEFEEFSNRRRRPCNYAAGRAVVDLGAGTLGAGLGMLTWGLRYRHDSRIYSRARFAVLPRASRGQVGLTVAGSF